MTWRTDPIARRATEYPQDPDSERVGELADSGCFARDLDVRLGRRHRCDRAGRRGASPSPAPAAPPRRRPPVPRRCDGPAPRRRPDRLGRSSAGAPLSVRPCGSGPLRRGVRERMSPMPSRQSWSDGSSTSNGATASRFGSRASLGRGPESRYRPAKAAATKVPSRHEQDAPAGPLPHAPCNGGDSAACDGARPPAASSARREGRGVREPVRRRRAPVPCRTARSTCSGDVAHRAQVAAPDPLSRRAMMACAVRPVNGGSPASISYTTQPSE